MIVSIGSPSPDFDWWSTLGPGITLIAAVIGWIVVEKFARRRERRSDLRELINILDASIDQIVEQAHEFYRLAGDAPSAPRIANSLKAKLATLAIHLNTIRAGGLDLDTNSEMRAFRQSVTGGAFESKVRPPIAEESMKFQTITMTGEQLSLKVKSEFFRVITKT